MKCLKVESDKFSKLFKEIESLVLELDETLKFKVMLICEEVITNQIRHTDFQDRVADIRFCFKLEGNDITLLFKDNAKRFNPLEKADPDITSSLEDTKLGGLGIFMVKKYSKEISYEYEDGYNILRVSL